MHPTAIIFYLVNYETLSTRAEWLFFNVRRRTKGSEILKAIFNDATAMQILKFEASGGKLSIKTIYATREELRAKFSDEFACKKIVIEERGQTIATHIDYTTLYRIEEYTGGILGVIMYQADKTPEVQAEVQAAAVMVAQIQAQALEDEQALSVQAIYPSWSGAGIDYAEGYKVRHNGTLYKCLQSHTSQAGWEPGVAPSLWVSIAGEQAATIDNPIAVPDTVTVSGMEYAYGKYYSESGTTYLMDRQGMSIGDTVILYFPPSQLVGQYFTIIE